MNVVKGEVSVAISGQYHIHKERDGWTILGLIVATNEVVHDIGVPDTLGNLFLVTDVPFLPKPAVLKTKIIKWRTDRTHKGDDLSEVARDLQMALLILVTVWYDDLGACLRCLCRVSKYVPPSSSKKTHTPSLATR